jgi:hypothetical protein
MLLTTNAAKSVFSNEEKAVFAFFDSYKQKNVGSFRDFDYDVRQVIFLKRAAMKIYYYIVNRESDKINRSHIYSVSNYYKILSNVFGEGLTIELIKSVIGECYWGIIGASVYLSNSENIRDDNLLDHLETEIDYVFPGTKGMVWQLYPRFKEGAA